MTSPLILSDTMHASKILGVHGGKGILHWKRLATGLMMHADWDSFEFCRLEPGAAVGEHVHSRTEEIYFIVGGHGLMHINQERAEVGKGDLIVTTLNTRHGIDNTGDGDLEFVVVEVLPPEIVNRLPSYTPVADFDDLASKASELWRDHG